MIGRTRRTLLAGIAALAVVAAACGGGATTDTEIAATTVAPIETDTSQTATTTTITPDLALGGDAGAVVAGALESTATVESAAFEGHITLSPSDDQTDIEEFTIDLDGAFSGEDAFSMRIDLSSALAAAGEEDLGGFEALLGAMEFRVVDGTAYISAPFLTMFTGYEWMAVPEEDTDMVSEGVTGANPINPANMLTELRKLDPDAEEIGRESVRGVETTHFRALIDQETIESLTEDERHEVEDVIGADGIEEIPFDVWIGDDGFLRRFETFIDTSEAEVTDPDQPNGSMRMVIEMFDINEAIVVSAPPAEDIAPDDAFGDLSGFGDMFGDLEDTFGDLDSEN